ncbi:MAG: histidine phosphatase family protein [Clostridia bacterium]|nr:histidine phosphatase family protein [Clostridia bacterium]
MKSGIKQSLDLKEQINFEEIDLVICSDLKRAIDSAEYTFKNLKEIVHDNRIRECNYGDLNGQDSSLVKYEEHINNKFSNGESLKDVEKRLRDFCNYLLENYDGKTIALVAHKAPQLALDVITKNITWQDAIEKDWRKTKNWQPGWIYIINKKNN